MAEAGKRPVDYDLSAPAIELAYFTDKDTLKGRVLAHFEKAVKRIGCNMLYANGTKQTVEKISSGEWFITIHPQYTENGGVYDFTGSAVFYKWCCKKGPKIIYDGFSESRAKALFPRLTDIERHFRSIIVKKGVDLDGFKDKNRGSGNHLVSWLETSELFGTLFLNKASEKYFLETIAGASNEAEQLAAYNATVADECGFGDHVDFFKTIHKLRNQIMHGRIITAEEYAKADTTIDKLEVDIEANMFIDAFSINPMLWENLNQTIRIAQEAALAAFEAVRPQLDIAQQITKAMQPQLDTIAGIGANIVKLNPAVTAATQAAAEASKSLQAKILADSRKNSRGTDGVASNS